jgi:predicted metal-dependent hydrolase
MDLLNWPPAYRLKKHPRAQRVKLRTSFQHGLELVIPPRFNENSIAELLEKHKQWIVKKLTEIHRQKQLRPDTLPTEINLLAIQQKWPVHYLETAHKKIRLTVRPQKELVLLGNTNNALLCKNLLNSWLKNQAAIHLTFYIKKMSALTGLTYDNLSIRSQQQRWGSCSNKKSISLNYKLLFLPPNLVEHIILHELCHTVHLNHSDKFWQLVASFDPHWKQHSKESRRACVWLPGWLE